MLLAFKVDEIVTHSSALKVHILIDKISGIELILPDLNLLFNYKPITMTCHLIFTISIYLYNGSMELKNCNRVKIHNFCCCKLF